MRLPGDIVKCCPPTVIIDPPAETPKEGFTPITVGACTTAKSAVNITSAGEQALVTLSVS
jgi:hypothetical protein